MLAIGLFCVYYNYIEAKQANQMRKFKYTYTFKHEKLNGKCSAVTHHGAYNVAQKEAAAKHGVPTGDVTVLTMKQAPKILCY